MTAPFQLHPRLQADCIPVGHFELCQLLLMNDSQYPWFILVPQVDGLRELYELSKAQQHLFTGESNYLAEQLAILYQADKMNIAAIGNLVPQLHIHHIVRYQTDKAWPAPVWGKFAAIPYGDAKIHEILQQVRTALVTKLTPIKNCLPF
ncbi:MAG: HIT domain-containing protein [Methylovulum sp.]|uniref:HIT domain-containing protein n=1 Tax=Methylovulum sp. TaxID=1916980 RepID=UPI00260D97B4|nr:HIT domain-containing protein [Methylovulum sp.]MDD2723388.1 HIT domain-containing protein [Methylovulum sp.]MDD5126394.1 HIT domain-containing protein [Methylovulum sp.]